MSTVSLDVAAALQAAGCGTVGTSIFAGPERAVASTVPICAIFVLEQAGGPPVGTFKRAMYPKRVTVIVRDEPGKFSAGEARAQAALVALHRCSISGYVFCHAAQSGPAFLGNNDTEQPRWSFSCELLTT